MTDVPAGPQLFVLGLTHHRVPIEVRERLALGPEAAAAFRQRLSTLKGLREFLLLSTCNRFECYGVAAGPEVLSELGQVFCGLKACDGPSFEVYCLRLYQDEAVQHLFEVVSGLDSQMLGENEIFGQVKEAYAAAQAAGSTGLVLNRLFQKAFQAAKQARTETAIASGQVSLANVAVDLAGSIFETLDELRILLIGAGEIGEKAARAFQSRGVRALTVCSRRFERAAPLAETLGASALPFEQREGRLPDFDVVVCATSAPDTVVSTLAVQEAMRRRPARPLLLLDLALPRDVEAGVGSLGSVYLYNLDDLARVVEENRRARETEAQKARSLLRLRSGSLWEQLQGRLGDGPSEP